MTKSQHGSIRVLSTWANADIAGTKYWKDGKLNNEQGRVDAPGAAAGGADGGRGRGLSTAAPASERSVQNGGSFVETGCRLVVVTLGRIDVAIVESRHRVTELIDAMVHRVDGTLVRLADIRLRRSSPDYLALRFPSRINSDERQPNSSLPRSSKTKRPVRF
ncbi:MAG: hypothetical protein WBG93_13480 [Thermoanaerobaculia bacterium]